MPVCPNGCADEFDAPVELESNISGGRHADICTCCGYTDSRTGFLSAA